MAKDFGSVLTLRNLRVKETAKDGLVRIAAIYPGKGDVWTGIRIGKRNKLPIRWKLCYQVLVTHPNCKGIGKKILGKESSGS